MPLEIYKRRHSERCLATLARRVKRNEIEQPADMQQYSQCHCAWWIRGTNDYGKFIPVHSLRVYSKAAAEAEARKLNQPEPALNTRTPIGTAIEKWIETGKLSKLSHETTKNRGIASSYVVRYAESRYTCIHQITGDDLDAIRLQWQQDGKKLNTQRTYFNTLRAFFRFCRKKGFLTANPMDQATPLQKRRKADVERVEEDENATLPIDLEGDENYRAIMRAMVPFLQSRLRYIEEHNQTRGNVLLLRMPENFVALLELMYHTGLRVSDALHFDVKRMRVDRLGGSYTTIQIKTGHPVTVFVPLWLVKKLQALPRMGNSKYVFFDGRAGWRGFVTNNVRRPLKDLGDLVGVEDLRPHRFRDSFAVNELNRGADIYDLQKLLGHASVATTERYYAPFVKSVENGLRERKLRREEAERAGKLTLMREAIAS